MFRILPFVLIVFLYRTTSTTTHALQITRTKEGDRVPGLFCEGGTLIFRDDETHSLQCVKSLEEAGEILLNIKV